MAAAVRRLNALAALDVDALSTLAAAVEKPRRHRAKREMLAEGDKITEALLILDGWAARQRILEDGRRQILHILLPGDLIGSCDFADPIALTSVVALTEVETCVAPDPAVSSCLSRAYALSRALGEASLVAQVTRIGRMNAQDRVIDLLLELLERLELAGLSRNGQFVLPLTQEIIADIVGLTAVHVNRTLQALRRDGAIDLRGRDLVLNAPAALRSYIGRRKMRVTSR